MYKIINLQNTFKSVTGEPYKVSMGFELDENGEVKKMANSLPVQKLSGVVKDIFAFLLGEIREGGTNRMVAYNLACRVLNSTEDSVEISEEECSVLKNALDASNHPAALYAQLTNSIVKAEENSQEVVKENPKK